MCYIKPRPVAGFFVCGGWWVNLRMIFLRVLFFLFFLYGINAQIALPTFQGVHKPHSSSSGSTVDGFSGQTGPVFVGWTQCEGYLDQSGGDDIPQAWGDDCTGDSYSKIKLATGVDVNTYRYIDVNLNICLIQNLLNQVFLLQRILKKVVR